MDYNLRARKHARARLALLDAWLERVETRPTEEISVRELCQAAEVSEASFFNYFGSKDALIVYFVQLWGLEMGWHARRASRERGPLAGIAEIFARTAAAVSASPRVMGEVLAGQARLDRAPELLPVTPAERALRFPDLDDLDSLPAAGLEVLLPTLAEEALAKGELPPGTDLRLLVITLAALFFGTPLVLRKLDPSLVGPIWQAQLRLLLQNPPLREAT